MDRHITLAHGSGGRLTAELVEAVFVAAFDDPAGRRLEDSAILAEDHAPGARPALTTDAFVVKPRFFPGGDIGKLSICGTVNDLAVAGARPLALSAAFIIEEGVAIEELRRLARSMADEAARAGVRVVAGDTKVVERGSGDGVYLTTAGYGLVPAGRELGAHRIAAGDAVLVSGDLGRHEAAVLLARGEVPLQAEIESDCASLNHLVEAVLAAAGDGVHALRDATRGGLATVLCEYAAVTGHSLALQESALHVQPAVRMVCELLGMDPLYLACEGRLVAVVAPEVADAVAETLQRHHADAGVIGQGEADARGRVVLETTVGGRRIVDRLAGGQLPRIC